MTFSTNSLGFRGSEPHGRLDEHATTVLFVGDSYTEGYGVSDGEEFPARIGVRLAGRFGRGKVDVVNAGIGDTGTGRALRFLRRWEQVDGRPLVLVYQFSPNDFGDNAGEGMFRLLTTGELIETPGDLPEPTARRWQGAIEAIPGLSRSYLLASAVEGARAAWRGRRQESPQIDAPEGDELTCRLVAEILKLARDRRWDVLMLLFELDAKQEGKLETVGVQGGAVLVRIPAKRNRPDLYYPIDAHWNSAGHAFVADRLEPLIEKEIEKHTDPVPAAR